MNPSIKIRAASEHNLKNISLDIPRNKLVTFVGVSGSGKSTLAIDIIANEGQRQYINSLNTYAARLLSHRSRPDVDEISGLSPTILVEQRQLQASTRSTVGTVTELYTLLRLIFSRAGSSNLSAAHFSFNNPEGACDACKGTGTEITVNINNLVDFEKTIEDGAINHSNYNRSNTRLMNILKTTGKVPFNIPVKNLTDKQLEFLLYSPRVKLKNTDQGFVQSYSWEGIVSRIIKRTKDSRGISETKEKKDSKYRDFIDCSSCNGYRLNDKALSSVIKGKHIGEYSSMPLSRLVEEVKKFDNNLINEITGRMITGLSALEKIGVGYLSLHRSTSTLSGGEAQRVRLAKELNSELVEMIYVLDEPTSGLHPRDIYKIIQVLKHINAKGNTVLIVEHDVVVMESSDLLIELGPKAGKYGGQITFIGTPEEASNDKKSITGRYLRPPKINKSQNKRRKPTGKLSIRNANLHNLKNINVDFPTGVLVSITGVSGSGKSTLVNGVFSRQFSSKVITVDQSQVGTTPRGNIATYTNTFDYIRDVFARENGVSKSLFSSNSEGACAKCKGLGSIKIDMHFMSEVKLKCDECLGKKYIDRVLGFKHKGKNIYEILSMTALEANEFFRNPNINEKLELLIKVGLDYLNLGQTLDTLSGGESQRLKLASKLSRKGNYYLLDEPTSGLHPADIERLIQLLHSLVDNGNSVMVIEHNLDVIANSDWIIDLGPEGGERGGKIIAQGTPEELVQINNSHTGRYLKKHFE